MASDGSAPTQCNCDKGKVFEGYIEGDSITTPKIRNQIFSCARGCNKIFALGKNGFYHLHHNITKESLITKRPR